MAILFISVIPIMLIAKVLWSHTDKIAELWDRIEKLEADKFSRSCLEEK